MSRFIPKPWTMEEQLASEALNRLSPRQCRSCRFFANHSHVPWGGRCSNGYGGRRRVWVSSAACIRFEERSCNG
jgi:hypothetical protein